jgi:Polysaccharide deacetylase
MSTGIFTISLDFELFWGVRDVLSLSKYSANILGVRDVVPYLLDRFSCFGVHCTWATVGLLFFDRKEELIEFIPNTKPEYANPLFSPYPSIKDIGETEWEDPYHYGLSLIRRIMTYEGQEIGTHTFSHYYCLEAGQTAAAFRADLAAARAAANRIGVVLKSLVFPRNQVNSAYLEICRDAGITTFRGNPDLWSYSGAPEEQVSRIQRGYRLVDCYLNLSGHQCYLPEVDRSGLLNIRGSRFLRPVSRHLLILDGARLRRIKQSMTHAARTGTVYHLWWHPHNFGADLDANARFLTGILSHYRDLSERFGMRSLSMAEIAGEGQYG